MKLAKYFVFSLIVVLVLMLSMPQCAHAQEGDEVPGRDLEFEQEIYARLEVIDPDAVPIFKQATAASDAGDLLQAQALFLQVLELAPDFPDALRRLSYVEVYLGNIEDAEYYARKANSVAPSPFNQIAIVNVDLEKGTSQSLEEAFQLALLAAEEEPGDFYIQWVLFFAAYENEELLVLTDAAEKMVQLEPDSYEAHYAQGIANAVNGEWIASENEIRKSEALGLEPEIAQEILAQIHPEALRARVFRGFGFSIFGWLVGMAALFIIGSTLSKLTMRTVENYQSTGQFEASGGERLLRSLYRVVVAVTSGYYYISIPFVILMVVGAVGAIFYLFLTIGQIPIRLSLFIVLGGLYTLFTVVRSLFVLNKNEDPRRVLRREEAPRLWTVVDEVANKVGERPVDTIYIVPDATIAVTERGRAMQKMRGKGQRSLILGLGALEGMNQGQFKAILAHEYGHFSNQDTAGGNFANRVRQSIQQMAIGLAQKGMAQWYNPAWWFFNGFYRLFLRVTLGASRLQEILADRYAALAYGAQNFIDGLKHVIRRGLEFESQAALEITAAIKQGRMLENLYALPALEETMYVERVEYQYDAALNRLTSQYDSHPSPQKRFDLVSKLDDGRSNFFVNNHDPVWDLLPRVEALQVEMTRQVQSRVSGLPALE